MMDELEALDLIDDALTKLVPDDAITSPDRLVDDGFRLTGAYIVGQYVSPDGRFTAMVPIGIGNMNAWTQEGIFRWALRRIEAGDYANTDEDDE